MPYYDRRPNPPPFDVFGQPRCCRDDPAPSCPYPPLPPDCGCGRERGPEIVCCGRSERRCMPLNVCVTGLPCDAREPFTLCALEASPEQPRIRVVEDCRGPSPAVAEVVIPLIATVRDACGRTLRGGAEMTLCCHLPKSCLHGGIALMAVADVRLIDPGCPSCNAVFDVRAEVLLEVYMVRPRAHACEPRPDGCKHRPTPPKKPFYPQPFY